MDVDRTNCTRDDVINQCVSVMAPGTSAAGQAMVTILPDLPPAASAAMCSHEGRPNPQPDRDTQFFPSQSQTEILTWERLHPGARAWCDRCEQPCSPNGVGARQQIIK